MNNADVTIRPWTPTETDYALIVALHNAVWPEYADTSEQFRFYDEQRDPKTRWGRVVAEVDGDAVGFASYSQHAEMYHPQKFMLDFVVLPAWEMQGVEEGLFAALQEALTPFDPILLRTHVREDKTATLAFVLAQGFVEEMREWESRLDVAAFDPTPFADAEERVTQQGITLHTLAELMTSDADWAHKLYDLDYTIMQDMPAPDTITVPSFEHYQKNVIQNPNLLPEGWFIARDGDKYVGESALWKRETTTDLDVGATGVRREYRRRGIALALKLRALQFARERGVKEIKTWNAQSNRAMLSINEALGFVKQPAWISFAKPLKEDA